MRWWKAANGSIGVVAATQSTRPNCEPSCSAAARANVVLPTPAGPMRIAPARVRNPVSTSSSAGSCGAVTH